MEEVASALRCQAWAAAGNSLITEVLIVVHVAHLGCKMQNLKVVARLQVFGSATLEV